MKEIVELSKSHIATSMAELQAVFFKKESGTIELLMAGPSHFSKELTGNESIQRTVTYAEPFRYYIQILNYNQIIRCIFKYFYRLCSALKTSVEKVKGRILIVERGDCTFIDKARKGQEAGAAAIIVRYNHILSNTERFK